MPPSVHVSAPSGRRIPRRLIEHAVTTALLEEGAADGEVSVTFLADDPIRKLNRRWLGHDWVTDVLSFSLHDPGEAPIGDIYVGLDQAVRQAREAGAPIREELCRLAIHGTLHVLGHDHAPHSSEVPGPRTHSRSASAVSTSNGEAMYERQEALLALALRRSR